MGSVSIFPVLWAAGQFPDHRKDSHVGVEMFPAFGQRG